MTIQQTGGLSIELYESLALGTDFIDTLFSEHSGYSHKISAMGGFDTCSFNIRYSQEAVEDWLLHGLGRHVIVKDEVGIEAWEGFVDSLDFEIGVDSITFGPVMELCNQVWAFYAPLTDPAPGSPPGTEPTVGPRTVNPAGALSDAVSIARYGTLQEVLSAGQCYGDTADRAVQLFLNDRRYPKPDHRISSSIGSPGLKINCKGYYRWLDRSTYSEVLAYGQSIPLSNSSTGKLQAVLTAARTLNSWCCSSDFTHLTANAILQEKYEKDDKKVLSLIKEMVALGDSSYNVYTFGMYENRVPYYEAIPTTHEYKLSIYGHKPVVTDMYDVEVPPYMIRPGKWLLLGDLFPGMQVASPISNDIRSLFIESVDFNSPSGFSLNGMKITQLAQLLAQLGTGGI